MRQAGNHVHPSLCLTTYFTIERDSDSINIDLSGKNFAKTLAKDSGVDNFFW
jgi:hypothetical protein